MSRRWSRVESDGDLWCELLEQDGVKATIEQAIRAANRPPREDFESYAWDEAVSLAMKYAGEHADDVGGFQSFLYVSLSRWAWRSNLQHLRGSRPPRSDEDGNLVEVPGPQYREWFGSSFDVAHGDDTAYSMARDIDGEASLARRRLNHDDPLAVVIKVEWLQGVLRRAERHAVEGDHSTTTDVFCRDVLCRKLAVHAGWCRAHYMVERTHQADLCTITNCTSGIYSKGMCRKHYTQDWRAKKKDTAA